MAIIKKSELKQIPKSKIDEKITELGKELVKFNAQRAVGTSIENPGRIKEVRRSIAKLLTLKNQQHTEVEEVKPKG
mgnify:CR=1 FL=1